VFLAGRAAWVTGLGATTSEGNLVIPAESLVIDLSTGAVTPNAPDVGVGTIESVSRELFDAWLFPFEATVLLLTIAAVGTVALARFGRTKRPGVSAAGEPAAGDGGEPVAVAERGGAS
jgi:NADH:ubiquinone oxidoreductase subunit 6 (subunit J)